MSNQTDLATVNPRTGNIIYEHIVETADKSRQAYVDEHPEFKPVDNSQQYKLIYTAFAHPKRCKMYLSQGLTSCSL